MSHMNKTLKRLQEHGYNVSPAISRKTIQKRVQENVKRVDGYFFSDEDAILKPYFYGSILFGSIVTLITLLTTI